MARTTKAQLNAFITEFNASHTVELTITEGTKYKKKFGNVAVYQICLSTEKGGTPSPRLSLTKASTTNSEMLYWLEYFANELKDTVAKVESIPAPKATIDPNFDPDAIDLFALFTNV